MTRSLSALEVAYLIKELKELILGAKIDKIYLLPENQELLLQLHIPNQGRKILRIAPPNFLYITEYKPDMPETPHGYCLFLRRHLGNTRLREIKQIDFERIIDFTFEAKQKVFHLMIELFSKGNIILCDQEYKILSAFSNQNWKDRTIRGGLTYEHPSLKYNFLTLNKEQFKQLMKTTDKESIVKTVALDLGLGGIFAEELCKNAGMNEQDKNKKTLQDKELSSLFSEIEKLQHFKYKVFDPEKYANFNQALDAELTTVALKEKTATQEKKATEKLSKTERIIKQQKSQIKKLTSELEEYQQKGDLIYQNYQLIKEILDQLKDARKKLSWEEIKAKIKDHKIVKEINEKNKQIIVEV